jgi:ornithine carbamoyltransferase
MHCLPAFHHPNTDQAGNRLRTIKAVLVATLG